MKKTAKANPQSDLHLVKPVDPAPSPSSRADLDSFIAEGMRSYQRLQDELDHELFARTHDVDRIGSLIGQKQQLRSRLAAHGVRVRI